jgi:hypothetical protein
LVEQQTLGPWVQTQANPLSKSSSYNKIIAAFSFLGDLFEAKLFIGDLLKCHEITYE